MARSFAVGQTPKAQIAAPAAASLLTQLTFSVVGWFKSPDAATFRHVYSERNAFNKHAYIRLTNSGTFSAFYRTPTANDTLTSASQYDDDAWHWFLWVRRATNDFELYVDGTSVDTSTVTMGTTDAATDFLIGQQVTADEPFTGSLGHIVFAGVAWTVEEARSVAYGKIPADPLRLWYEMDGPFGQAVSWSSPAAVPAGNSLAADGGTIGNADGDAFTTSTDGGETWAANDNPGGTANPVYYDGLAVDGSFVHVLSPQAGMGGSEQRVDYYRSTDGGDTWASAFEITSAALPARRITICADGAGNVYTAWHDDTSGPDRRNILFRRSGDDGATWESIQTLASGSGVGLGGVHVDADPSTGTVLVAYTKDVSGVGKCHVRRSTDSGATFGSEVNVGGTTGAGDTLQARPRISMTDGRAIVCWEGNTDTGPPITRPISGVRSTDDGVTWSSVEDFLPAGQDEYNHQNIFVVPGGVTHLVANATDTTSTSGPITYRRSTDYGATWVTTETAYSSASEVQWGMVADTQGRVVMTTAVPDYVRRDTLDVETDWSGNGRNGTPQSTTLADHPPIGPRFGADAAVIATSATSIGMRRMMSGLGL